MTEYKKSMGNQSTATVEFTLQVPEMVEPVLRMTAADDR
jgi:hypothetical protein